MDVAANEVHCVRLCDARLFNDIVNSLFAAKINFEKTYSSVQRREWRLEEQIQYISQCNGDFLQPWKPLCSQTNKSCSYKTEKLEHINLHLCATQKNEILNENARIVRRFLAKTANRATHTSRSLSTIAPFRLPFFFFDLHFILFR